MKAFLAAALSRKAAVLLILVLTTLWGIMAYVNIPKESTPDVKIPILYISAVHEGISPQDAERLIIRPLEQQLKSLDGVREMRSTAFEGGGYVLLEFSAGSDITQARISVREKIDAARPQLPEDIKDPTINEVNLSLFPVLIVKLSGKIPQRSLHRIAHDLQDRIESSIPSVLKAEIVGTRQEAIEVLIDPARIQSYALSFETIMRTFTRNNQLVSAGHLENSYGCFAIKVPGVFETVADIMSIPLANSGDAAIRLLEVAEVRRTFKDPQGFARDSGVSAVALEITKRIGENLIETIDAVKKVIAEQQQHWPPHITVGFSHDQSKHIHEMLVELQNSLILAILLVMLVMVVSLGWRQALLVGIAVPGSFLMGIMLLSLMGYTINIVVLFSLIFSVGMLVDGAIIVVEYADRRIADGVSSREAFLEAAQRMVWPVISSITTILVVFLPLLFWPGVVGQFMKYMPITLIIVLGASLLMALIFVPTVGGFFKYPLHDKNSSSIEATEHGNLEEVDGWTGEYIQLLKKCLNYPGRVIVGAMLLLIAVKTLHGFMSKGVEFFPAVEPDSAIVWVHGRGNLSVFEKDVLVRQVEERLLNMPELSSLYTRSGTQKGGEGTPEDVIGSITIEFIDWQKRRKVEAIFKEILERTQDIAGLQIEVIKEKSGPSSTKPIELQVSTSEMKDLFSTTRLIRQLVDTIPGLKGVEDNTPLPGIEWEITIDRAQAAKFDADVALVGNAVKLVTNGILVGKYRPDDSTDEIDILVRYLPDYRHLEQLKDLRIVTPSGSIPIANFVTLKPKPKIGKLYRVDGLRVFTIRADVAPGVLVADKIAEIQQGIHKLKLPPHTKTIFKGEARDRAETGSFLGKAFGVAIFFITIILLIQFNSFFSAALVLSAVVMSSMGIFIGLMIHSLPFGIVMGGIGVIALAGIIVSNNIILIDTYDLMVKNLKNPTYEQLKEAIIRTCAQRLRPVILTKLTAILGLLPIMFGISIDFIHFSMSKGAPATQWWILLSLCIVYGLLFASSLTLVVTPAVLMARVNRRFGKKTFSREDLIPASWRRLFHQPLRSS